MESFFRYISYVDYYKKGEKVKNVGFLRWKLYNGKHKIEFQVKDVSCPKGNYQIEEKSTGKIVGEIVIDKGIGNFIKEFSSMSASGEMYIDTFDDRLYLSDIEGFKICLNSDECLFVLVSLGLEKKADQFKLLSKKNHEEVLSTVSERLKEEVPILIDEESQEEDNIEQTISFGYERDSIAKFVDSKEKKSTFKETGAASENVLIEGIEEKYIASEHMEKRKKQGSNKEIEIIEPIHEDKWQQLCKEYQNVHPFPDRKVFLSIKPEDFIILQQEYQKLVHNSFLLHGFYNYGYMILGKLAEDEKAPIYIGVPGVYYEREKQAAQMFGFVGFESTEHPVQAGSYGYYMIEVEI